MLKPLLFMQKPSSKTPDDKSTPASNIGMEGGGAKRCRDRQTPAQTSHTGAFLGTETFFVCLFFFCPIRPRYVNKRRESIYLYFCTEETLGTKTLLVLCLHAGSGVASLRASRGFAADRREDIFIQKNKKGVFFLSSPQHSTHPGAQKVYG